MDHRVSYATHPPHLELCFFHGKHVQAAGKCVSVRFGEPFKTYKVVSDLDINAGIPSMQRENLHRKDNKQN
jgi:hypothetical protein